MSKPYTGIIGAGPVGGILGAYLAAAGENVVFVDILEEHLEAIRTEGLAVTGVKDFKVVIEDTLTDVRELSKYDLEYLFIAVKTTVSESLLPVIREIIGPETVVISYQNGLYAERPIADAVGAHRTLRMVLNYAGYYESPGRINFTFFQKANHLGALDKAAEPAAKKLAKRLNATGLDTEIVENIAKYVWEKVILNVILGPLCAIARKTMKGTLECAGISELSDGMLKECIEVARAEGFEWDEGFYERCRAFIRNAGAHKPSILVDVEAGRRTEIDSICGKVAEFGRKHGIPTPYNETITTLVNAITS
ncbi:MAG: ketopantoate reductase family protein [Planctomycetota bacterium]|jgi:2-dehydropantoate 2-reductase